VPHTVLLPPVADPGQLLSVSTVTDPRPGRAVVEVVVDLGRRAVLCPLRLTGFSGLIDPDEREGHDVVAVVRQ